MLGTIAASVLITALTLPGVAGAEEQVTDSESQPGTSMTEGVDENSGAEVTQPQVPTDGSTQGAEGEGTEQSTPGTDESASEESSPGLLDDDAGAVEERGLEISDIDGLTNAVGKASGPWLCAPGTYLSISHKAPQDSSGTYLGGQIDVWENAKRVDSLPPLKSGSYEYLEQFNGLGIAPDGTVYAQGRFYRANSARWVEVYRLRPGATSWESLGTLRYPIGDTTYWVAGGVDPTTGIYYFGKYKQSGWHYWPAYNEYIPKEIKLEFELYKFDPNNPGIRRVATVIPTETITVPDNIRFVEDYWFLINGDLAFDALGNLYIMNGHNLGTDFWTITADHLATASGTIETDSMIQNRVNPYAVSTQFMKSINGIAFNIDGRLSLSTLTHHYKYNLTTGSFIDMGQTNPPGTNGASITERNHVDLASCTTPPTLEVRKELAGPRYNNEQFRLSISRPDGSEYTVPKDTEGTGRNVIGNVTATVISGETYGFGEEIVGNPQITSDAYRTTWECRDKNGYDLPTTGTYSGIGMDGEITVPNLIKNENGKDVAPNIVCTFTNTPRNGRVVWSKINDSGNELGRTVWNIRPASGGTGIRVEDCVADSSKECSGPDIDPSPGKFRVENLAFGDYVLTEIEAPPTYEPTNQPNPFSVTFAKPEWTFGTAFVNEQKRNSVSWEKVDDAKPEANPLPGSKWTLTRHNGDVFTIEDCVEAGQCTGYDVDSRPGKFKVEALKNGTYTLKEIEAPEGYEIPENGNSVTFDFKEVGPDYRIEVPFVNPRLKGSVTWKKVDDSTPTAKELAGSEWVLTGPGGESSATITVKDCVTDNGQQCPADGGDSNPAAGVFEVKDLAWGNYTLVESKAPAGYQLITDEYSFTIDADNRTVDLKEIVNNKREPTSLPLTGGLGREFYTILGAGLFGAGFAVAIARKIKKSKR